MHGNEPGRCQVCVEATVDLADGPKAMVQCCAVLVLNRGYLQTEISMKVRQYLVKPRIPEALAPLKEIASNLWYSWNWDGVMLFSRLNPELWEKAGFNPVRMLGMMSAAELQQAADDESYVATVRRVRDEMQKYLTSRAWASDRIGPGTGCDNGFLTAYFSTEYGIDKGLPIYSGGLGVLSGDHLKSASDLGLPLVGVGLLYQKGYFKQALNLDGWQQEEYPENDWYNMPVTQEMRADGSPLTVTVNLADEDVVAAIWRVQVGRTPLYLLDTNLPQNSAWNREVTSTLYGGDREMRIRQEVLLGIGGVKALRALNLRPTVFHMNEGHSAFLAVERIRQAMEDFKITREVAMEYVISTNVFTTHTPVPAGNETFDSALMRKYVERYSSGIGLEWSQFESMGKSGGVQGSFGMTVFALRTAGFANGVSKLHGSVSRKMWRDMWPSLQEEEIPITHVTNGIHTRTWVSPEMDALLDMYLGPRYKDHPEDHDIWDRVKSIPSSELWRIHVSRKERLMFYVRKHLRRQFQRQGAGSATIAAVDDVLNPDALTIGFSRRFATYKRAGLLFQQPERLVELLTQKDRPVQIVFAGKAHPQDLPAKEIIKKVVHFTRDPRIRSRVVFLEDYDINVAKYMVQGVDVWLNTPRRPLEASGTSGMKAAVNGALNLSVLDGWWDEGYSPDTGWEIGGGDVSSDVVEQDRIECEALFDLLEKEVVPLYYDRDRSGLPVLWIEMMKASISKLGAMFNTARMVSEYAERAYLPAHIAGCHGAEGDFKGFKDLAAWKNRVRDLWPAVRVKVVETDLGEIESGVGIKVMVEAEIGALRPEDVRVEVYSGLLGADDSIHEGVVSRAEYVGQKGGAHIFEAQLPSSDTGRHGYAARILPVHDGMPGTDTPIFMTWES